MADGGGSGFWRVMSGNGSDAIGELLRFDASPPFPVLNVSYIVTAALTYLLFGPQRPARGEEAPPPGQRPDAPALVGQVLFVALVLHTAMCDLQRAQRCLLLPGYHGLERLQALLCVWASSPNMLKALAASGIVNMHDAAIKWPRADGAQGLAGIGPKEKMGPVAVWLYHTPLMVGYSLQAYVLGVLCLPAAIAYGYFALPCNYFVVVMIPGGVLAPVLAHAVARPRRTDSPSAADETGQLIESVPEEHQNATLDAVGVTAPRNYDREKRMFRATGAPMYAWKNYLMYCAVAPVLELSVAVNARLLCGHGYWAAITTTFFERSLGEWWSHRALADLSGMIEAIWLLL